MIYFIQDEASHHIKIGYTGSDDPESRRKALQTGNPRRLTIIAVAPGDKAVEADLHKRFAHLSAVGEWFQPGPDILKHIAQIGVTNANHKDAAKWPLNIYLAGKIRSKDWRDAIIRGEQSSNGDSSWPVSECAIDGTHGYTGPYYQDTRHGTETGRHGEEPITEVFVPDPHHCHEPSDGEHEWREPVELMRLRIHKSCLGAIGSSDVVFAWIDSEDCHGTLIEIGLAKALGKMVWICTAVEFRELWFAYRTADTFAISRDARLCLLAMLAAYRSGAEMLWRFPLLKGIALLEEATYLSNEH